MSGARQQIARERRRQMQVRQALVAGLAQPPATEAARARFLLACADYLLFAMDRLYVQDQGIDSRLRQYLPPDDAAARRLLDDVAARLAASRGAVEELRQLAGRLRGAGLQALPEFEAGIRRFTAGFEGQLRAHRNPMAEYTDRFLGEADWAGIAAVSAASESREAALFAEVRAAAPPGADPETFTSARPSAGDAPPQVHA